jgi:hypothetical protein
MTATFFITPCAMYDASEKGRLQADGNRMVEKQSNAHVRKDKAGIDDAQRVSRDKKNATTTVSLRIPTAMLKDIDKAVKARPYKMPRHMWLLEAVHEKIARLKETDPKRG